MPLHQDRTFLQQDQSRVGADDRFQKDIIGHKKRILGTGIITPCSDSLGGRTRHAIKAQTVLQGVIVYIVDLVNTLIIRILQTGAIKERDLSGRSATHQSRLRHSHYKYEMW